MRFLIPILLLAACAPTQTEPACASDGARDGDGIDLTGALCLRRL